jgi:hypothetical protein
VALAAPTPTSAAASSASAAPASTTAALTASKTTVCVRRPRRLRRRRPLGPSVAPWLAVLAAPTTTSVAASSASAAPAPTTAAPTACASSVCAHPPHRRQRRPRRPHRASPCRPLPPLTAARWPVVPTAPEATSAAASSATVACPLTTAAPGVSGPMAAAATSLPVPPLRRRPPTRPPANGATRAPRVPARTATTCVCRTWMGRCRALPVSRRRRVPRVLRAPRALATRQTAHVWRTTMLPPVGARGVRWSALSGCSRRHSPARVARATPGRRARAATPPTPCATTTSVPARCAQRAQWSAVRTRAAHPPCPAVGSAADAGQGRPGRASRPTACAGSTLRAPPCAPRARRRVTRATTCQQCPSRPCGAPQTTPPCNCPAGATGTPSRLSAAFAAGA